MATIYICGDCASKEKRFPEWEKVIAKFKSIRCEVVCPSEMAITQMSWSDKLQNRIEELKKCQAVYVLPNWKDDIMARIELTIAMDLKLETIFHPASNKDIRQIITTLDN